MRLLQAVGKKKNNFSDTRKKMAVRW